MKKSIICILMITISLSLISCISQKRILSNPDSKIISQLNSKQLKIFENNQYIGINAGSDAKKGNTVTNKIFGTHMEYFKEPVNFRDDPLYWAALKKLNSGVFRFPGGEDADNYLWKTRQVFRSDWFYTAATPATDLNTESFIDVCKKTDAEPIIVINYDAGASVGNIEKIYNDAVDWAKYTNITKGFKVRYWEFGNEEFIPILTDKQLNIQPEEYARQYLEMRKRLKAVDKDIMLGANMPPSWDFNESWVVNGWAPRFFAVTGDNVDFITPHAYYTPSSELYVMENSYDLSKNIESFKVGMKDMIGKEIPIMLTEWNIEVKTNVVAPGGIANGVLLAEGLMSLNSAGVAYACIWPLRWAIGSGSLWEGHSFGLVRDYNQNLTPTGEVFAFMASEIIGWTQLQQSFEYKFEGIMATPYISKDNDSVRIILTNRSTSEAKSTALQIDGKMIKEIIGKSIVSSAYSRNETATYTDIKKTEIINPLIKSDGRHILIDLPPLSVTAINCKVE